MTRGRADSHRARAPRPLTDTPRRHTRQTDHTRSTHPARWRRRRPPPPQAATAPASASVLVPMPTWAPTRAPSATTASTPAAASATGGRPTTRAARARSLATATHAPPSAPSHARTCAMGLRGEARAPPLGRRTASAGRRARPPGGRAERRGERAPGVGGPVPCHRDLGGRAERSSRGTGAAGEARASDRPSATCASHPAEITDGTTCWIFANSAEFGM